MSPCYASFEPLSGSYASKVTPVCPLDAEKRIEAVFFDVVRIAFTASLFTVGQLRGQAKNKDFTEVEPPHSAIKSPIKKKCLCLGPIWTPLQATGGFLIKTKIKAYTKLTVVICCQIVD